MPATERETPPSKRRFQSRARRHRIGLAAFFAVFSSATPALAEPTCAELLQTLEDAAETDVLVASSGRLQELRFRPDSRSAAAAGRYVERETRIWESGRSIEFRNTLVCTDDGELAIAGTESLDENEPSIEFDDPLVWLPLPAEAGASWHWSGTFTTEIFGSHSKLPAEADGRIVGWDSVDLGGTQVEALEVELELEIGKGEEKSQLHYRSWFVLEPRFRPVKRTIVDVTYGETSAFAAPAPPASPASPVPGERGTPKKVIIIESEIERAQ